ncbi:MAG: hypothetical protein ABSE62_16885 [Chthoniobacteraceae bacterium]|jgi:predicted RNase H-like nuclease (RuvC/YqgF family)
MPEINPDSPENLRFDVDKHEEDLTRLTSDVVALQKEISVLKEKLNRTMGDIRSTFGEMAKVIDLQQELFRVSVHLPPSAPARDANLALRKAMDELKKKIPQAP